jgi:hypothetical protein
MAYVLTEAATIRCSHAKPGSVSVTGSTKLTVGGTGVVLIDNLPSGSIHCLTVDDANSGTKHCTSIQKAFAGASTKLTVGGIPVALATLKGPTDGAPVPITYSATNAGQSKLKAV